MILFILYVIYLLKNINQNLNNYKNKIRQNYINNCLKSILFIWYFISDNKKSL